MSKSLKNDSFAGGFPKGRNVLVGITGGIAVYKICTLVNLLMKDGHRVKVVMTQAATNFVGTATFSALTKAPTYVDIFDTKDFSKVEHIHLADWCDVFIIAPATANTISKIAHGAADNLLTTITLAIPSKTPVVIAPAMNVNMWENPLVQENISKLENIKVKGKKKYYFVEPRSGLLACGDEGKGKIADSEEIIKMATMVMNT